MKKPFTYLIPAWETGDTVEIIGTGLIGRCMTPVGITMDVWFVSVPKKGAAPSTFRVHATGLRVPDAHL